MERLAWVCLGSALGGGARYLVSLAALNALGPTFPWGTLFVNVVGSYLIGTAWKEVLYLLLFIAILTMRPAGIFGQRGAEALGT